MKPETKIGEDEEDGPKPEMYTTPTETYTTPPEKKTGSQGLSDDEDNEAYNKRGRRWCWWCRFSCGGGLVQCGDVDNGGGAGDSSGGGVAGGGGVCGCGCGVVVVCSGG